MKDDLDFVVLRVPQRNLKVPAAVVSPDDHLRAIVEMERGNAVPACVTNIGIGNPVSAGAVEDGNLIEHCKRMLTAYMDRFHAIFCRTTDFDINTLLCTLSGSAETAPAGPERQHVETDGAGVADVGQGRACGVDCDLGSGSRRVPVGASSDSGERDALITDLVNPGE